MDHSSHGVNIDAFDTFYRDNIRLLAAYNKLPKPRPQFATILYNYVNALKKANVNTWMDFTGMYAMHLVLDYLIYPEERHMFGTNTRPADFLPNNANDPQFCTIENTKIIDRGTELACYYIENIIDPFLHKACRDDIPFAFRRWMLAICYFIVFDECPDLQSYMNYFYEKSFMYFSPNKNRNDF